MNISKDPWARAKSVNEPARGLSGRVRGSLKLHGRLIGWPSPTHPSSARFYNLKNLLNDDDKIIENV